ncbi:MAG: biotin/lipoyl-binding protein [Bacteroidales bacterium]|nr:biotin/lipoyl-binding protein [Bacteroidales bacterium]
MEEKNGEKKLEYKSLNIDLVRYKTLYSHKYLLRKTYQKSDPRMIHAFIPGIIRKVNVKKGSPVEMGETLLVLEAMKMKNEIHSPIGGTVKQVHIREGQKVTKSDVLIELE